jgi:hypothetical protein
MAAPRAGFASERRKKISLSRTVAEGLYKTFPVRRDINCRRTLPGIAEAALKILIH